MASKSLALEKYRVERSPKANFCRVDGQVVEMWDVLSKISRIIEGETLSTYLICELERERREDACSSLRPRVLR